MLNVYGMEIGRGKMFPHSFHFWENVHHPKYTPLRYLAPDLGLVIRAQKRFADVIKILESVWDEYQSHLEIWTDEDKNLFMETFPIDYDEFLADLMARRWQKELPNERIVHPSELININSRYFMRSFVDWSILKPKMLAFSKEHRVLSRT